ncbi:MAG: 3'-5' exonuclease [Spirochaetaceae bacterium]|nr:3'-5' exonuclease [Spirochaetaceae bacterium]
MRDDMKSTSAVSDRPNAVERTETTNDFDRRLMCDNVSKPILVVDVETTGLDPAKDTVVQIAACKLDGDARLDDPPFVTYVRPDTRISDTAEAVHGLKLTDLRTAPSIAEAIRAFNEYAPPDAILCGHNIAFDVAFLKAAYTSVGIGFPFDYHLLDVWSVSFFLLETQRIKLNPHNLSALCDLYGIPRGHKHDALEDVQATALILSRMFDTVRSKHFDVVGSGKNL